MADVFEHRKELDPSRDRLWQLIVATPALDWLLLTKRPHLVESLWPWGKKPPANVWLGTTAENQRWAEKRVPPLLEFHSTVRFLSCEPLLGPIDLSGWLNKKGGKARIDWVIAGGESGAKARPMKPEWLQEIRETCQRADVAFFFKQWGAYGSDGQRRSKKANGRTHNGMSWDYIPLIPVQQHQ